jgi:hypothetical protein
MSSRLRRFGKLTVEVAEDRLLANDGGSVGEDEGRNRVRASCPDELDTVLFVDWHLTDEIDDAELGQPLPDTSGGWAPLGLVELEHSV